MTLEIPLPDWEQVRWWHWTIGSLLAWYWGVALVLCFTRRKYRDMTVSQRWEGRKDDALFWLISPLAIPVVLVIVVVWTALWMFSLGVVPSPWDKDLNA